MGQGEYTLSTGVERIRAFHPCGHSDYYTDEHISDLPIRPNKFQWWDFCLYYHESRLIHFNDSEDWEDMGTGAKSHLDTFRLAPKLKTEIKRYTWVWRMLFESWFKPSPSSCTFWIHSKEHYFYKATVGWVSCHLQCRESPLIYPPPKIN